MLSAMRAALGEKGTKLSYDKDVLSFIAKNSYSEKYGARNMRRYIERAVEDGIAEEIISANDRHLLGIHLFVEDEKIKIKSI